jgi:nucleoside-diphosphate-sugar epimerase
MSQIVSVAQQMQIAITGGTGFVGRALARDLSNAGHTVVVIARGMDQRDPALRQLDSVRFVAASITDEEQLVQAFTGCDAVAHCAGINRELGAQTYQRVHVQGTQHVIAAAQRAGVPRVLLLSYLHARPNCDSPYHETKWAAEELIRSSGLEYTILKAGMIYGSGDHMLSHISETIRALPIFATVGVRERTVRPVAVEDVIRILHAALIERRLAHQTVAVVGPEELGLSAVVQRVGHVLGKHVIVVPLPVIAQYMLAWLAERLMPTPIVTRAQVRMLADGISTPLPGTSPLPDDLAPQTRLSDQQIRKGLPAH